MKKIKLISLYLVIFLSVVKAQNYQAVRSDRTAFFKDSYSGVKCIRIDSVKLLTDSILFPFSNIQELSSNCFSPTHGSWIGKKVIIQNNGYNIFLNKERDSIKIKTNALLEESWTAYELVGSTKIIAKVAKYDTLSFLGQVDSVKTINFQVYDNAMTPVVHNLNNMSIVLSKNFGLIKTLNFYRFPNSCSYCTQEDNLTEFDLIGLSNPKIGTQNLTWFDVNDFQAGDEIHVSAIQSDMTSSRSEYSIFKYLERTNYSDSIKYKVEVKQNIENTSFGNSTSEYIHDTITTIIKGYTLFDKLPGEPIIVDGSSAYSFIMSTDNYISKTDLYLQSITKSTNTCWSPLINDIPKGDDQYIKGLGGPYYQGTGALGGSASRELVYYKKKSVQWGTPLLISGIADNNQKIKVELFPNPAKNYVWIKTQTSVLPLTFELIDLTGQIVLMNEINNDLISINVNQLPAGKYLFRLRNKQSISKQGKLVIE